MTSANVLPERYQPGAVWVPRASTGGHLIKILSREDGVRGPVFVVVDMFEGGEYRIGASALQREFRFASDEPT